MTTSEPRSISNAVSLAAVLAERCKATPDAVAFRERRGGRFEPVLYKAIAPRLEAIAAGLLTAGVTLGDGDRVSLMGNAGLDWIVCDFAALSIGLQTVPIYASLRPDEIAYMHADTVARIVFVDDKAQLEKLREAQRGVTFRDQKIDAGDLAVKHIVVIQPEGIAAADDWESLADLEARGRSRLEATADERARRASILTRETVATFTYTSGTTGVPKAVIQTHDNMLSMLEAADKLDMFGTGIRTAGLFLFLPPAHSFGRLVELAGPFLGATLVLSSVPTLVEDLGLSRPGFFPSAPRVYEKMKTKIENAVEESSPLRQRIFRWALSVGERTIEPRSHGRPLSALLAMQAKLAHRLVWSKLQERLGLERAVLLLSGSAPLSPTVHRFFLALGLDLVEAYGLTETCPGLTANMPNAFRVGTVGRAFPGVELKIADDGEILARGPNITAGYLNQAASTADAFSDGWFCTGDLGSIDADGYLSITGRKKELIKTSGGKYVAPAKIEEHLKRHRLVQEAVVIGDGHNYCVCLIALDDEELALWSAKYARDGDPQKEIEAIIQAHVDEVNAGLASFESMKKFRLTGEMLSVENQMLTASLKVRRGPVSKRYAHLIDEMYA